MELISNYLKPEWWRNWLEETFPEDYGYKKLPWRNGQQFDDLHWYKNGNIFFSLVCYKGTRPRYYAKINGLDNMLTRIFDLENSEMEMQFIEALAKPEFLPLCINIPYALPFINYHFKQACLEPA